METRKNFGRMAVITLVVLGTCSFAFAQQWEGSETSSGDIFRTGNVGIGTDDSPLARLHIDGSTDLPSYLKRTSSLQDGATPMLKLVHDDTGTPTMGFGQSIEFWGKCVDAAIRQTASIRDYKIDGSNNSRHGLKFSVHSNSQMKDVMYLYASYESQPSLFLGDGEYYPTGGMLVPAVTIRRQDEKLLTLMNRADYAVGNEANIYFSLGANFSGNNYDKIYASIKAISTSVNYSSARGVLVFSTMTGGGVGGYPSERMRIDHQGNIGIGTTQPDQKLTVKGKIHAEEVIVDLNVPGPDYVFEDDYPLPPLSEVEQHIKQNKHLPGIPTAQEVAENGMSLGEMQTKLLEKIEELTLYVIELKKENEVLENKVARLEEKYNE